MTTSKEKLAKLMMMTTSNNDHEALVALRKANALLAECNTDWADLFTPKKWPVQEQERRAAPTASRERVESIEEMFNVVLNSDGHSESFMAFLLSIYNWYQKKGDLTGKQFDALQAAYERSV